MYLSNMNEQKINSHFSACLCPNYDIITMKSALIRMNPSGDSTRLSCDATLPVKRIDAGIVI